MADDKEFAQRQLDQARAQHGDHNLATAAAQRRLDEARRAEENESFRRAEQEVAENRRREDEQARKQRERDAADAERQAPKSKKGTKDFGATETRGRLKSIDYLFGIFAGILAYSYLINAMAWEQANAALAAIAAGLATIYLWKAAVVIAVFTFVAVVVLKKPKNEHSSPIAEPPITFGVQPARVATAAGAVSENHDPNAEEYVAHVGGDAKIVPVGQLKIDNHLMSCADAPTVFDSSLDDYSASYRKFVILNPRLLAGLPTSVKLWAYSNACGHVSLELGSDKADCFAVELGKRQGWLTAEGFEHVCEFISASKGIPSQNIPAGVERCEKMRGCFTNPVKQ